jgi:ubiquinone/menaquinone biosynthesis C-methylase UbiE
LSTAAELAKQRERGGRNIAVELAKRIILGSQNFPLFAARGAYSSVRSDSHLDKADFEYQDTENFLENIPFDFPAFIRGKSVLDYGSGYGGRTVWMSEYAEEAAGIEVMDERVAAGEQFAKQRHRGNCRFLLGDRNRVALPDDSIDVITSFDVLEHVRDPEATIREFFRVLKPGGVALIIFTPYYGAFAHHLNYATLFPALHWVFSPRTLMRAISELEATGGLEIQVPKDVAIDWTPKTSFNGKRMVLPSLNGITKREFLSVVRSIGFECGYERSRGVLEKWRILGRPGAWANRALCSVPLLDELFAHNLTVVLKKPVTCRCVTTMTQSGTLPAPHEFE